LQFAPDNRRPDRRAALRLGATILLFGLLGGLVFSLIEHFAAAERLTATRSRVLEDTNRLRVQIEKTIAGEVQLILGLTAYVRARPNLDQRDFEAAAAYLLGTAPTTISHVALARDLVVTHIHPVEGNESAIGLDYRLEPTQWPAVQRAVERGEIVVAGPLALVQGGVGMIARVPIFLPPSAGPDRLWGVASVVVDFDAFLEAIEIDESRRTLDLAIYGRNGGAPREGLSGEPILGDPAVLEDDPVLQEVALGAGFWTVAARPIEGWPRASTYRTSIFLGYLLFLAVVTLWLWRDARARLERERANQALRRAKAEADEANRAKSHFLATMSHELRTPLNAIIGFSDFLLLQLRPPAVAERQLSYIRDIRESGRHLLSMINDILDLARIESRETAVPLAATDVRDVAGMALRLVSPQARAKGVRLRCALPRDLPPALANERALQQVLINLLANAVRHTQPDRRVYLRLLGGEAGTLVLQVEDEGEGIAEDRLALLGHPFATSVDAFRRSESGAGLGLAISAALVQRMNGSLTLTSRLGEGTVASVTLPAAEGDGS